MDELRELALVVHRNKVKQIEIIGSKSNSDNRMEELYNGLVDNRFSNEQEAAKAIYGTGPENINFKKLKYRLEKRLINSAFFIDVNRPDFNELQKAYYICHKNYAAVKILMGKFARKAAMELAKKTLKRTIKFEFTDLTILLLRELYHSEILFAENFKKREEYAQLLADYEKVQKAESLATEYYINLLAQKKSHTLLKGEALTEAKKYEKKLLQLFRQFDSYQLKLRGYRAISLRYEIADDYQGILNTCKKAVSYFESKENIQHKLAIASFLYRILISQIQLQNYPEAEKAAIKCLDLVDPGTNNWMLYRGYYVLLCFHSGQYAKAYDLYYETHNHQNFKQLYQHYKDFWLTLEAFIHYLVKIGRINPEETKQPRKRFRLSTFLNDVPLFAKDKRGSNIPILILQVLFLLEKKEYEGVFDRVQALEMYTSRYLKHGNTFRSNCFIKMLLTLPKAYFHREGVLRRAAKYRKRLAEMPLDVAGQSSETEFIPYEQLWEMVVESLENRFYYMK